MNERDKNYLINRLAETHSSIRAILEETDLDICVYIDTDWRIKDIIGHIATWDRQVTQSLIAFKAGKEYSIPELDEDAFNQQEVLEGRKMTAQQVLKEWEQARKVFIEAVQEIPLDRFPGDLLYPWGDERGSIAGLVGYMVDHDIEHRDEIVKAIQASNEV
jgi:hypothetical protein